MCQKSGKPQISNIIPKMETQMFMLSGFFLLLCAQALPIAGKPIALLPADQVPDQNEDYSQMFGRDGTSTPDQTDPSVMDGFFDDNTLSKEAAVNGESASLLGPVDTNESLKSFEALLSDVQASRVSEEPTLASNSSAEFSNFNETGIPNHFECTDCASDGTSSTSDFAMTTDDSEQTYQEMYHIIASVIGLAILIFTIVLVLVLIIKWVVRTCKSDSYPINGTSGNYRSGHSFY